MLWQNGYWVTPYRDGLLDRIARLFGRFLGMCLPYLPYLMAAILVYNPREMTSTNWLWVSAVLIVIGGSIAVLERGLLSLAMRLKEGIVMGSIAFWVVNLAVLVLHIWAMQAGTAHLFRGTSYGQGLSMVVMAIFIPIAIVHFVRARLDIAHH